MDKAKIVEIVISQKYINEALEYAKCSRKYTSNRHDFHSGGLDNKQQKMFEGKLGEKGFKIWLESNSIPYIEDQSSYEEADEYDFYFEKSQLKIDVKTRTQDFHIRTLEMVEQFKNKPKDIYISVRLINENSIKILGWFSKKDLLKKGKIENNGYLDNYVMYDNDLRPISELIPYLQRTAI